MQKSIRGFFVALILALSAFMCTGLAYADEINDESGDAYASVSGGDIAVLSDEASPAVTATEVKITQDTTWSEDVISKLTENTTYIISSGVTLTLDSTQSFKTGAIRVTFSGGTIKRGSTLTDVMFKLDGVEDTNCQNERLTFTDVVVDGNKGVAASGSIVYMRNTDSDLMLLGTTVLKNNWAVDGGAVYMYNKKGQTSKLTMGGNASIQENTATRGGALYMESGYNDYGISKLYMRENSAIKKNTATYGGAVCLDNNATATGRFMMTGNAVIGGSSLVDANVARYGGGIFVNRGNGLTTLENVNVKYNKAQGTKLGEYGYGGGIFSIDDTRITGTSTVIEGNQADYGGGACAGVVLQTPSATLYVENGVTINKNVAQIDGGGICGVSYYVAENVFQPNYCGTHIYLCDAKITNNSAGGNGGGISNIVDMRGNTTYQDAPTAELEVYGTTTISGNYASKQGGGIYNAVITPTVKGASTKLYLHGYSTISDNTCASGGAGIYTNGDVRIAEKPTVQNNTSGVSSTESSTSNIYLAKSLKGEKSHFILATDSTGALIALDESAHIGFDTEDANTNDTILAHADNTSCKSAEATSFVADRSGVSVALDTTGIEPANLLLQVPGTKSSMKRIASFSLSESSADGSASGGEQTSYTGTIDQINHTIAVSVPADVACNNLVATFTSVDDKATVLVGGTQQTSGKTAQNFNEPVTYTVSAEDGTTQDYVVTVTREVSTIKAITAFSLTYYVDEDDEVGTTYTGTINQNARTIEVVVPYRNDVSALVASFTLSTEASVYVDDVLQVSGKTPHDFASPITYKVFAAGETTNPAEYVVTVSYAPRTNETFSCEVDFTPSDPTSYETKATCWFEAVKYPEGDTLGEAYVARKSSSAPCVDVDIAGAIDIPETVTNSYGERFTVIGVRSYAFSNYDEFYKKTTPKGLTGVTFPSSVYIFEPRACLGFAPLTVQFENENTQFGYDVLTGANTTNIIFNCNADKMTETYKNGTFRYLYNVAPHFVFRGQKWNPTNIAEGNYGSSSDSVFYYTVRFYDTEEHARAAAANYELTKTGEGGCIGQAAIEKGTTLSSITQGLETGVFDGSVPALPGAHGMWAYTNGQSLSETLNNTVYAYPNITLSSENALTSFSLEGVAATIDDATSSVSLTLPYGTDLSSLVTSFSASAGATVYMDAQQKKMAVSGSTKCDYTNPLTLWVCAEDGQVRTWTVSVNTEPNTATRVLSFSLSGYTAFVNDVTGEIEVSVPVGIDTSALIATFELSDQAKMYVGTTEQVSGVTANDCSSGLTYTVVAGDGVTKANYKLKVAYEKTPISEVEVSPIANQIYDGAQKCPSLTITYNGRELTQGIDYSVTYADNIDVTVSAVAMITGMGDFSGTRTVYFKIVEPTVRRAYEYAGDTRYETAGEIVSAAYPYGCNCVIVASGEGYADALAASGLAGVLDCPVLLTSASELSSACASSIESLAPSRVIIVGGSAAISSAVEDEIARLSCVVEVKRLAGETRYGTCKAIYDFGRENGGYEGEPIIATGTGFADALSIAPYAVATKSPVILVGDEVSNDLASVLKRDFLSARAIICGGNAAVSTDVENWLAQNLGTQPVRLSGATRYETSLAIARFCVESAGFSYSTLTFANGGNYPDALAGGVLCGKTKSPLLLCSDDGSASALETSLSTWSSSVSNTCFLGGGSAIAYSYRQTLLDACGGGFSDEW